MLPFTQQHTAFLRAKTQQKKDKEEKRGQTETISDEIAQDEN
jgi:hypothetical protein